MRIKLNAQPWYCGELYKTTFVNGESTTDVSEYMFERFEKVLGLDPEWIPDTRDAEIAELKAEVEELKRKLAKKKEQ